MDDKDRALKAIEETAILIMSVFMLIVVLFFHVLHSCYLVVEIFANSIMKLFKIGAGDNDKKSRD